MKTITEIKPAGHLQEIVSHYSYKVMEVPRALVVPACTEQFMEFYLEGQYQVIDVKTGKFFGSPPAIFIGQQTTRNWDLQIEGHYKMFFIHFQPSGFHQLFGVPMHECTDRALEPSEVISKGYRELQSRLCSTTNLAELVRDTELFLTRQLQQHGQAGDAFQHVIQYVLRNGGDINLNYIVNQCNITVRQFERKFLQQVGIPPKLFIKKTRFNHLLEMKKQQPEKNWTELTYLAGYFDQAHMIHDFRSFASDTPSRFIKRLQALPEIVIS